MRNTITGNSPGDFFPGIFTASATVRQSDETIIDKGFEEVAEVKLRLFQLISLSYLFSNLPLKPG